MRILIVSEQFPGKNLGGLARHALTLGVQFRRDGHHVDFLGNARFNSWKVDIERETGGKVILDGRMDGGIWSARIERRIGVYPYIIRKNISKRIAAAVVEYGRKYDVIHYHGHYPTISAYVPPEMNLVITHHDHGIVCPNKILLRPDFSLCNGMDTWLCDSCYGGRSRILSQCITAAGASRWQALARSALRQHKHIFVSKRNLELARAGLRINGADNLFVIHNFIDCERLKAVPDPINSYFAPKDGRTRVLLASSLIFYKGIRQFLLEVAKKHGERSLNIVVAGDAGGGIKAGLEKEFDKDIAKFVGWLSYEKTIYSMRACDCYVLPSLVEESCSTSILEALYIGKDVRGLRRGGTPELKAYSCDEYQMKLHGNIEEMVDAIIGGDIFQKSGGNAAGSFDADVAVKACEIRGIYDL